MREVGATRATSMRGVCLIAANLGAVMASSAWLGLRMPSRRAAAPRQPGAWRHKRSRGQTARRCPPQAQGRCSWSDSLRRVGARSHADPAVERRRTSRLHRFRCNESPRNRTHLAVGSRHEVTSFDQLTLDTSSCYSLDLILINAAKGAWPIETSILPDAWHLRSR